MVLRRLLFVIFALGALVGASGTLLGAIATDPVAFIKEVDQLFRKGDRFQVPMPAILGSGVKPRQ